MGIAALSPYMHALPSLTPPTHILGKGKGSRAGGEKKAAAPASGRRRAAASASPTPEEKARAEEQRIAAAAAAAAKQAEEARLSAERQIEEMGKAEAERAALRRANAPEAVKASRARHQAGGGLKSDLKKTTALVKKLKGSLTEEKRAEILRCVGFGWPGCGCMPIDHSDRPTTTPPTQTKGTWPL